MTPIRSEQEEFITLIQNRFEELDRSMTRMQRARMKENDMETLARFERFKKSVAEKGDAVQARLDEAEDVEDETEWPEAKERLEEAWREYQESVDRAKLEFERVDELS